MIVRSTLLTLVVLALVGAAGEQGASGQPARSGPGTVIATFDDARTLATDPLGRLYVADGGEDAVVVLGPRGEPIETVGGSGVRAGEFDTPSDVDATNGQVLLVADTYNGRVQRFSTEGQFLESFPIGEGQWGKTADRGFDDGSDGSTARGQGRPVAVDSRETGAIYVLDERNGALLRWTDTQGMSTVAGGSGGSGSPLEEPVGLALGENGHAYVADAAAEAVLVFDRYGTFLRELPTPPLPELRDVVTRSGRLWIVETNRVLVWETATDRLSEPRVTLPSPVEDVQPQSDVLYILTPTRLLRKTRE